MYDWWRDRMGEECLTILLTDTSSCKSYACMHPHLKVELKHLYSHLWSYLAYGIVVAYGITTFCNSPLSVTCMKLKSNGYLVCIDHCKACWFHVQRTGNKWVNQREGAEQGMRTQTRRVVKIDYIWLIIPPGSHVMAVSHRTFFLWAHSVTWILCAELLLVLLVCWRLEDCMQPERGVYCWATLLF